MPKGARIKVSRDSGDDGAHVVGDACLEQAVDAEGERQAQTRPGHLTIDEAHHQHRDT